MDLWTQYEKYRDDLTYTTDDHKTVKVCVGLAGTFYFWHGEQHATRLAIANCFERFQQLFGTRLQWVLPNDDVSRSEVRFGGKKPVPSLPDYIATMDADDALDWRISGGKSADEASDCYMAVLTTRQWEIAVRNPLSWLSFAMPIDAAYGPRGNPALFTDFVRYCCEQLKPWHGLAGLASLLPQDEGEAQDGEFDLQQRYFGLDVVSSGYSFIDHLQRHLKGANWLTIFDREFPTTLSLDDWTQLSQTPGMQVWRAGTAYVAQAGDQPTLGPVPDGIPPLYKAVSDALKPVRLSPMPSFHTGSMTGAIHFNGRTSELWAQRFDAPGIWPPYPDQVTYHAVDTSVDEYAAQPSVEPEPPPPTELPRVRVLRALPGEPCPRDGEWFNPFLKKTVRMRLGEPMPGPETTEQGAVIWYLRETE
ncbi:type VI immunity family protein [Ralstonia sp. UBA689]|uniref:type VI immunity family protein n=1 Tax=Ralstonia sp. UBA689 TaxID=1947373 RepID=UPI0025EEE397|nr:type VI immunity family protein [Ralstonia sp. UBA689]